MKTGPRPTPSALQDSLSDQAAGRRLQAVDSDQCGYPCADDTPCRRPAGWGTEHEDGPCRDHQQEPEPKVARLPEPPPGFPDAFEEMWWELGHRLQRYGLLTELSEPAFVSMLLSYTVATKAGRALTKSGLAVKGAKGVKKNPIFQIWRDANTAWRQWATEFGLTPSSQERVQLEETEEMNELEDSLSEWTDWD